MPSVGAFLSPSPPNSKPSRGHHVVTLLRCTNQRKKNHHISTSIWHILSTCGRFRIFQGANSTKSPFRKEKESGPPNRSTCFAQKWICHRTDNQFRQASHDVTEFIIKYRNDLKNRKYPVKPLPSANITPGYLPKLYGEDLDFPNKKGDFQGLLKDINEKLLPGTLHWEHPDFYGWVKTSYGSYHNVLSNMARFFLFVPTESNGKRLVASEGGFSLAAITKGCPYLPATH